MTEHGITATVHDAIGQVCADVMGMKWVYAAGVIQSVKEDQPIVVPQAEDFADGDLPVIVVGLGDTTVITQPGNDRIRYEFLCTIWRPRFPLGEVYPILEDDLDHFLEAFVAHAKAYLKEPHLQSAVVMSWSAPSSQSIGREEPLRWYLILPITVEVVVNVPRVRLPA